MRIRTAATVAVAGLLMLTAACTGDAGGPGQDSGESAVTSTSSSAASQAPVTDSAGLGGRPIDPAQFVSAVGPGFQGISSITGTLTIDGPAITEDGTYQGTYRDGKVTGMSVDMTIVSHGKLLTLTMVAIDGSLFVRSAALATELQLTKPWLLIRPDSSNPEIAQIAMTLSAILDGIGPAEYAQFAAAVLASSDLGDETIDGAPAHHFRALLDPDKTVAALDLTVPLSPSAESTEPTGSTGPSGEVLPVRVDVWLDELGRAVTTTTTQTVANEQTVSTNHVIGFNRPVTITAPDPADVATP